MLSDAFATLLIQKKITMKGLEKVLDAYNLTPLLPSILKSLKRFEQKEVLTEVVNITTPFDLSEKAITAIKKELHATGIDHTVTIDPSLLLGFTASYKETNINTSARLILNRFINSH